MSSLRQMMPRRSAVVFDVGTAGVRAVQASRFGGHHRLRDALCLRRPLLGDDAPDTEPAEIARLAARMIGQGRFQGREVGLVLAPPHVSFHALRVADSLLDQPATAVCEALAWEVAKELRAEATDLEVRYWPLPANHRQGLNVMSVSMPRAQAHAWVRHFGEAGLGLRRIDVAPCTLLQFALTAGQAPARGLWVIIDLGLARSHITVLLDRTPVYIRTIETRGDTWTREIAQSFDLDYAEAEALKKRHGLRAGDGGDNPLHAALHRALREPVEALIHETTLCCRYVGQSYVGCPVERVLLAGGGAHLPGLADRIQTTLDVPVAALRSDLVPTGQADLVSCVGGALRDLEAA